MKHLIICREYPPAPGGGIGTYVLHMSRLLAESGETVHVIGQLWEGAEKTVEEFCHGRLIIHRVPFEDWTSSSGRKLVCHKKSIEEKGLFESEFPPQCFSWQAGSLAERLVEQEGIAIIESQEYEAPLYYFLLRRALGLGPKKYPPCFVHLHSPTEFIARYNDWNTYLPFVVTAKRLEDYTILAADALLCPSQYLARQVKIHHGLAEDAIKVIPYPLSDVSVIERSEEVWENGTICYVGRLERRKGVIEWIDAAVSIAHKYPSARFEFVGANVLGTNEMNGAEFVRKRIPDELSVRFYFHGKQKRSSIPQFLAMARIAVVPSRWENFPNTCIETMCSGLPVIASSEGGMVEIIEDGRTGWLANKPGTEGLAEALMRALETPSLKVAEMGRNASLDIRQMCDNKKIVEDHMNFRTQLVNRNPARSFHLPFNLSRTKNFVSNDSRRQSIQKNNKKGIAIVVTCFNNGQFLDDCLQSIKLQTQKPSDVVIVDDKSTENLTINILSKTEQEGWRVIRKKNGDIVLAKNTCIEIILSSKPNLLGFVFLNTEDRLQPGFIAACESVLQHCPEVGIVSCWTHYTWSKGRIRIKPCPGFPYQWLSNEAVPFSAVRTDALRDSGYYRSAISREYDDWDLFNAVMAAGWVAVTLPEILGKHRFVDDSTLNPGFNLYGKMHQEILGRFPDLVAQDAGKIALLALSNTARLQRQGQYSIKQMIRYLIRRIILKIVQKVKSKIFRHN